MAKVVKYKKPRAINVVSVSLALIAAVAIYLTIRYLPLFLVQQEAFRVLDETASVFSGSRSRYLKSPEQRLALEKDMRRSLQEIGVKDPGFETWIEVENEHSVRIGVAYIQRVTWPLDAIPPQESVIEREYHLTLP